MFWILGFLCFNLANLAYCLQHALSFNSAPITSTRGRYKTDTMQSIRAYI